ncbi:MAG: hypothetical protein ED859_10780 [Desulfuromonadales bacterium]|nr:MAG: hypothetical protein ED859_10780 [Desulfuromonadales bacterium]
MRRLSVALTLAGACLAVALPPATAPARAESGRAAEKTDFQRLAGTWVRPDGGYRLELKEIKKDGSLKATYYNPRPINVARAELRRKDTTITLFVELRDVNYPGSTYNLRYDPKNDRLIGIYFQAVEKQNYDVEFARTH